jgi:DNA-binding MarR family transcriptional regulator
MTQKKDHFNDHIGKWIAVIHLVQLDVIDRKMAKYGLSRATFGFLAHLYMEDGLRQDNLIRETKVNKSTIARAVQKLEKLGYVTRRPDETDRRVYRVYLTAKAEAIRGEIIDILDQQSQRMLHGFTKKQVGEVFDIIHKIYENVRNYRNELETKN